MNLLDQLAGGGAADDRVRCSRKGCQADASWQLLWNNPRIHTPDRRKVWLACGEHRAWLEEYLQVRSLWKDTVPLGQPDESDKRPDV